jgi:hypothetical protein
MYCGIEHNYLLQQEKFAVLQPSAKWYYLAILSESSSGTTTIAQRDE